MLNLEKIKNTILEGDALEILPKFSDKSFNLVITSPPYNVGKNNMVKNKYGGGDKMSQEEYLNWTRQVLNELLRVAHTTFYNVQMLSDNKRTILTILGEYKEKIKDIIIWYKSQVQPAIEPGVMNSAFEFIIIFSDDFPEKRKFKNATFHGNFSNVIKGKSAAGENKFSDFHKATFPLYLPMTIIKQFSQENDIILDPFMGLGTTALAAQQFKRKWLGIELNPDYIKIDNPDAMLFPNGSLMSWKHRKMEREYLRQLHAGLVAREQE